jgi:hypothetical protein
MRPTQRYLVREEGKRKMESKKVKKGNRKAIKK